MFGAGHVSWTVIKASVLNGLIRLLWCFLNPRLTLVEMQIEGSNITEGFSVDALIH